MNFKIRPFCMQWALDTVQILYSSMKTPEPGPTHSPRRNRIRRRRRCAHEAVGARRGRVRGVRGQPGRVDRRSEAGCKVEGEEEG